MSYSDWVDSEIKGVLLKLRPENYVASSSLEECPMCFKESFTYYPEYEYGECNECSFQKDRDTMDSEIGKHRAIYADIKQQIMSILYERLY